MRRIADMGIILLLFLVGMNTMIFIYSSSIGVTVQFSQISPDTNSVQGLFKDKNATGSVSIIEQITSLVSVPAEVSGIIKKVFDLLGTFLFGYENIFKDIGLPVTIIDPIFIILKAIIVFTLVVIILDITAALRGGTVG